VDGYSTVGIKPPYKACTSASLVVNDTIMGVTSESIYFEDRLPTAAEFVTALCQHTGEAVLFAEYTEILSCVATGDAVGFWALAYEPDHSWTLRNLNLEGGYLWEASFAVLQLLGGKCRDPHFAQPLTLPAWAYQPWRLAKHEYKKRRGPWFTHVEACQHGLGWK
jgi:hypothetical protein